MKIGLKIKYTKNIPIFLPHLKELQEKIDYFEFGLRPTENYKEYQALLQKSNLFATLHAPLYDEGINLVVPQKNKANLQSLKFCQKAADFFNSPIVVLHPGDRESKDASLNNLYFLLSKIGDQRFALENTPLIIQQRHYRRLGIYLEDFLEFRKRGFKTCFDFGHALLEAKIEKKDYYNYLEKFINTIKPQYYHLSGSDGSRDCHWAISNIKSIINYEKIIPLLPKEAFLTLEINFFDKENRFDREKVFKDIDYLRKLTD